MNTRLTHRQAQFVIALLAAELIVARYAQAQPLPIPPDWLKHSVTRVSMMPDSTEYVDYTDNPDVAPESHVLIFFPSGDRLIAIGTHIWADSTNEINLEMGRLQAEIKAAEHERDSCMLQHVIPHYPACTYNNYTLGEGSECTLEDLQDRIDEDNEDYAALKLKSDKLNALINPALIVKN